MNYLYTAASYEYMCLFDHKEHVPLPYLDLRSLFINRVMCIP